MRSVVRSELIRIWRPTFLYGGIGVMAIAAGLVSCSSTPQLTTSAPTPVQWVGRGPGSLPWAKSPKPAGS
jgi:hypothetical protein